MYSNILLTRQWSRLACLCRPVTTVEGQKLPQSGVSSDGITPPPRIPRGPTDILLALAATVGPDPTAAHYKYHDDPYLIPLSNFRKRSYALSAEAGRKAAAWIRDEHADWFSTRQWDPPGKMITPYFNADPHIDAFSPKPIYNDESKVTEEDLKYTIQNALLEDSVKVFQLLGGTDGISEELKMAFLQLLCFYNEKEPDSAEWMEERWFASNTRERQAATWKMGGLADKIFTALEHKTPESYCAIIQGMAKYYQAERAHALAQEAREQGIQLSTSVYNSLISCVGFLKEGTNLRSEALLSLLREMNEQNLSPDKETLTSCLRSISAWGGGKMLQQLALQIIAEFKQLGIQPDLSAYYYLLCLFCKERGPRIDILTTILNDLESRDKIEAIEATDTNFFITAMGICSDHLQDINMAERLHSLLMKDDNYKLVGDAYKESIYYRHLVTVNCRHAPFEKTIHLLDTLIPNIYVPEPSVMEEIIRTLELGGAGERLAQAWSQLVIFGHAKKVRLVENLLEAMCNCYQYQVSKCVLVFYYKKDFSTLDSRKCGLSIRSFSETVKYKEEEVKSKMRDAATDILKFGNMSQELDDSRDLRTPVQKLSASALSNIIELCSDSKDKADPNWDTVSEALEKLTRDEAVGVPAKPEVLADVANKALSVGRPTIAAATISYLAECGFEEALPVAEKVLSSMLNRSPEEVQTILQQPSASLASSLHPTALAVVEAYQLAKTGAPAQAESASSSESDSETSDDE